MSVAQQLAAERRRLTREREAARRKAAAARYPFVASALGSLPPTRGECRRIECGAIDWITTPTGGEVWSVPLSASR